MTKKTKKPSKARAAAPSAYMARVRVTLKPTVNDPEGNTISGALGQLGFGGVESVRAGKFFEVRLTADDARAAEKQVEEMCARLLANPVIETYQFKVEALKK